MITRTYTVGDKSGARRLDNLTGAWIDIPLNLSPLGQPIDVILRDVMTDPNDGDKVFAVGQRSEQTGALGIYVSSNAGATWSQPGGDIALPGSDVFNFFEVWVVDSDVIYACGEAGHVFKSLDGGVTFNRTLTLPTATGNSDVLYQVQAIHFISPTTGVIGTSANGAVPEVWKTTDGGATWTRLNGDAPFPALTTPDRIRGIHLSADETVINVTGERRHIRSTDSGNTFTTILSGTYRHLTWRSDDLMWIFGSQGNIKVSIDAGATWVTLSPPFALSPEHKAGHFYTDQDGFYGSTADILSTNDQAATGTVSETSPYGVEAVWTFFFEEVVETPCGCPEGFTYDPATDQCVGFETTDVTSSGTIYNVINGDTSVAYGWGGANFYENIDSKPLPISSTGGLMADNGASPLVITNNVVNTVWGDSGTATSLATILNQIGVWGQLGSSFAPAGNWIGFTACVEAPETKVYYVGLAADNRGRFKVNGTLQVQFQGCSNTFNFNYWHVFPITLNAGTNIIELEGLNCGSDAAFAAEIYDADLTTLLGLTSGAQREALTIFSTLDKIGSTFDLGGLQSGYSCPQGWILSLCEGVYQCVRESFLPFEPCNCYLATDCEDPTRTMLITTENELVPGEVYQFEGFGDDCWTVEESVDCPPNDTVIPVVANYVDCTTCAGVCYLLSDCAGNEPGQIVANDLAEYVGQVVKITRCPDICWFVEQEVECPDVRDYAILEDTFLTCEECNPPAPVPPLELKHRKVKPGHDTKGCPADYVTEVSCNFAEAVYQEIVSNKYGIEFCCDALRSLDEWAVKFELMQLKGLIDPDVCTKGPDLCCPPRCVEAEIIGACASPRSVYGQIIIDEP